MDAQRVFELSMEFSQKVWDIVIGWNYFEKDTVGKQLVRSADSISANLKEGAGRYHFRERNQFNLISRGSLFETQCWLQKALTRSLVSKEQYEELNFEFDILHLEINKIIKNTRRQTLQ